MKVKNARITSASITIERGGILTAWLGLDYGGAVQGFGGFALDDRPPSISEKRSPSAACGLFIREVLDVVGVERWEDLVGKSVRVKAEDRGVLALGHFLDDRWFEPGASLDEKFYTQLGGEA